MPARASTSYALGPAAIAVIAAAAAEVSRGVGCIGYNASNDFESESAELAAALDPATSSGAFTRAKPNRPARQSARSCRKHVPTAFALRVPALGSDNLEPPGTPQPSSAGNATLSIVVATDKLFPPALAATAYAGATTLAGLHAWNVWSGNCKLVTSARVPLIRTVLSKQMRATARFLALAGDREAGNW